MEREKEKKKAKVSVNNDLVTSFLGPCDVGEKQCMEDEEKEKKLYDNNGLPQLRTPHMVPANFLDQNSVC